MLPLSHHKSTDSRCINAHQMLLLCSEIGLEEIKLWNNVLSEKTDEDMHFQVVTSLSNDKIDGNNNSNDPGIYEMFVPDQIDEFNVLNDSVAMSVPNEIDDSNKLNNSVDMSVPNEIDEFNVLKDSVAMSVPNEIEFQMK